MTYDLGHMNAFKSDQVHQNKEVHSLGAFFYDI